MKIASNKNNQKEKPAFTSFFNFLNDAQIPTNQNSPKAQRGRKIKTNASLISDKAQTSKNSRLGTNNKDYSFVLLKNSRIDQNIELDQQNNEFQANQIQKIKNQQQVIEQYKNWVKNVKKNLRNLQGKMPQLCYHYIQPQNSYKKNQKEKEDKQAEKQKSRQKYKKPSSLQKYEQKQKNKNQIQNIVKQSKHNYVMVQISSISDIVWHQYQKIIAFEKQTWNNQLYYKLVISLQQQEQVNGYKIWKSHTKKITTQMIKLQKIPVQNKLKSHFKHSDTYGSKQKFSVYLHTQKDTIYLKIQLILYDSKSYERNQQNNTIDFKLQTEMVIVQEAFSYVRIPINLKNNDLQTKVKINVNKRTKMQFEPFSNLFLSSNQNKQEQPNLKQKQNLPKPYLNQKQQRKISKYGIISFFIHNSQYYKLLRKLIPSEYLVWHEDLIPGLIGGHLPKIDDMLFQINPSTQTKSLTLQVQNLEIKTQWFTKAQQKLQKLYQTRSHFLLQTQQQKKYYFSKKCIQASLITHNSIKQVNRITCNLSQKMELHKKIQGSTDQKFRNNYGFSQLNKNILSTNRKMEDTNKLMNQASVKQLISFKIFSCPSIILPQIFYEQNCLVIFQIQEIFEVKQLDDKEKVQKNKQISIPIAFTFYFPDKILNNRMARKTLYEGSYLNQLVFNKGKLKKVKEASKIILGALNNVGSSRNIIDGISIQGLTKNNILDGQSFCMIQSVFTLKQPIFDESWTVQQNKIQQSMILKNQLLGYPSNMNKSMVSQQAKINIQKQKVLSQFSKILTKGIASKNPKKQNKKIAIRQPVNIIQNAEGLYIKQVRKQVKNIKSKLLIEMKEFLSQKNNLIPNPNKNKQKTLEQNSIFTILKDQASGHLGNNKRSNDQSLKLFKYVYNQFRDSKNNYFSSYGQIFSKSSLKSHNITQPFHNKFSWNLYQMFYNYKISQINLMNNPFSRVSQNSSFMNLDYKDSLSDYKYQKIPIELIRSQITQINYNYLIFINPISLKPLQMSNNAFFTLPNKFFIKILFWNMQTHQSPAFKIQPQTGEIFVSVQNNNHQQNNKMNNQQNNHYNNKDPKQNKIKSQKKIHSQKRLTSNNQIQLNELRLKKIFHFQYGTQNQYSNTIQNFIQFIQYLYNGLMEVRLYDQFHEIGKSYFRLRNLIRKRKNQTSVIIEEQIHSTVGPICQLKIQMRSLRKQKPANFTLNKNYLLQKQEKHQKQNISAKNYPKTSVEYSNKMPSINNRILDTINYNMQQSQLQFKRQSNLSKQKQQKLSISSIYNNNSFNSFKQEKKTESQFQSQHLNQKKIKVNQPSIINFASIQTQNKMTIDNIQQRSFQQSMQFNKQRQRIQRFKKLKVQNQTKHNSNQNPNSKQMVNRIIQRNYLISQYKIKVTPFKKTFLFIELQNKSNKKGTFNISVIDPHYENYKHMHNLQLKIIRNIDQQIINQDKQKILAPSVNRQKIIKYKKLSSNYQLNLQEKQKFVVLCQYQSKRRIYSQKDNFNQQENKEFLTHFNTNHTLTVSLLQSSNQTTVCCLSKIHVIPQSGRNMITLKDVVKKGQNKLISFPFLLSKFVRQNYIIYTNLNRCSLILEPQKEQILNKDQKYLNLEQGNETKHRNFLTSANQRFSFDLNSTSNRQDENRISNNRDQLMPKFALKRDLINQQNLNKDQFKKTNLNINSTKISMKRSKKQKTFNFLSVYYQNPIQQPKKEIPNQIFQNKIVQNDKSKMIEMVLIPKQSSISAQPIFIQIELNQIQKQQKLKIPLFQPIKSRIKIIHRDLQFNDKIPKIIGIVCQDFQFKTQDIWFQLDSSNSYTEIQFKYMSTMYGIRSFEIKIINPVHYTNFNKNSIGSQFNLQLLHKCYLKRMLFTIVTPFPALKSQLVLNLSMNISNKEQYEQPFAYMNSNVQKTVFNIYSSHPWFMSVDEKDRVCQIKGKSQKKLKLKINIKKIIQQFQYNIKGSKQQDILQDGNLMSNTSTERINNLFRDILPVIVLSFGSDKAVEHFGFKFKII